MWRYLNYRKWWKWIIICALLTICGCQTAGNPPPGSSAISQHTLNSRLIKVPSASYVLAAGDEIEVKFYYHRDLNDTLQIRPDGKISLPLVHEMGAAGLTTIELESTLTNAFGQELKNPDVAVIVRKFAGQIAYIGGEIKSPGMFPLSTPTSLLQAIIRTGDILASAEDSNVVILRSSGTATPEIMNVDLRAIRSGKAADIMLEPYDIVYVPKTVITRVNEFVEQYINRIVPRAVSFPFMYQLRSGVDIVK